jgi:hypothetical protein
MRNSRIFEFANAFLLGLDMRALTTGDDARFVDQFLGRLLAQDEKGQFDDESDFGTKRFRGQIHAFRKVRQKKSWVDSGSGNLPSE